MTAPHAPLFRRIDEFTIDEGTPALTFADRLARENGWTMAYTKRLLREYRRFLCLTQVADHMVVPSEEVDQAWHLHLTYTRSYWDRLCGQVLGRPLHHNPTQGGPDEGRKFAELYHRTLATYAVTFGEYPPSDIWPDVADRFGGDWRRVDAGRYWLIRKPRLRVGQAAMFAALPLTAGLPLEFYPFTLKGTEFFGFYLPAYAATFVLALLLRRLWSKPALDPNGSVPLLDSAAAAYLAGGADTAVNAAVASLVARGALTVGSDGKFCCAGKRPTDAPKLERVAYESVASRIEAEASEVRADAEAECANLHRRLTEQGLLVGDEYATLAHGVPLFVALAVPALGLLRLASGLTAGRPVGFLVVALIVTTVLSVVMFARRPFRSRRGDAALRQMRTENSHLQSAGANGAAAPDLALGVALFGVGVLAGGELDQLRRTLAPPVRSRDGGGCDGGCSSSDCGGGDSGGGGCGGGGCGGGGCGGCGGE